MEAARALARRTIAEAHDDEGRLAHAFRLCLAREPDPEETALLAELLSKARSRLADGDLDPWALVAAPSKDNPRPDSEAAWTVLARALLNLDETITKQ